MFDQRNFHKNTFCVFREMPQDALPQTTPHYKSKSGSAYYFTQHGVFRMSDHWGRAARCKWRLDPMPGSQRGARLGYAAWTAFHRDNDWEKLYYIAFDAQALTVRFEHRDGTAPIAAVLRTAPETAKRIKQIRQLLENDQWLAYYEGTPQSIRETVVRQLIETEQSLVAIKNAL